MIKLSKSNPITRMTRWAFRKKGLMKMVPTVFRYGGWLLMRIYQLFGMNVLLLTTNGRKSGKPRTTPAMYVRQGKDLFIAAIPPGTQRIPNWYDNLVSDPNVPVELFWKRRRYYGESVQNSESKIALLERFPFGLIEAMQDRAPEDIPIIHLVPQSG